MHFLLNSDASAQFSQKMDGLGRFDYAGLFPKKDVVCFNYTETNKILPVASLGLSTSRRSWLPNSFKTVRHLLDLH